MTQIADPGVVVYRNARGAGAIDEYSRNLVSALCAAGTPARYTPYGLSSVSRGAARPAWILVQYNPFSYGRWGIAPRLVGDAIRVRRRWPRTPLVLTVHEAWVAIRDWRSALMGTYQRSQLRLLLRLADAVIVVRETLARELGRACAHIPVGSNIAPTAVTARVARARLGVGGRLVVALFGKGHPSRALDHAEAAIAALSSARGVDGVCVMNLGRDSPDLTTPPGVEVRTPGFLVTDELSVHLRASDVLLLPLSDGLSTRRGTLMAGLAHGLPVVGLRGFNTDRILVEHPEAVALSPLGDLDAFAREVLELTADPARMRSMGDAGRLLYQRNFDWPIVARGVLAAVRGEQRS